jgi:hypothetical protein
MVVLNLDEGTGVEARSQPYGTAVVTNGFSMSTFARALRVLTPDRRVR